MIRRGIRRALHLALPRRDRWEREVEDEITLHLALRAEQLAAQGLDPDDAYREAVRKFGPLGQSRTRLLEAASRRERTARRAERFGELRQDLAFALRTLRRQRGWTAITVLTLALGIGASTAVFSVVSTLLIHRVPYPHGDRVVDVVQQPSNGNTTGISVSILPEPRAIVAWQRDAHAFESVQALSVESRPLRAANGDDGRAWTAAITPGFFDFAAVRPLRGRIFSPAETAAGARVALLGEGFWRSRLGADSAVIGKTITLADTAFTVIGIMPAAFRVTPPGRAPTDVWLPLDLHAPRSLGSAVVGRLRPGVSAPSAERELDSIYARVSGFTTGSIPFHAVVERPSEGVSFRESLLLLTGAVGLLLLVACTNVAHLLLARTAARRREIAIRTALGAATSRLFRQLLVESALLCVAGAAAGLAVGGIGVRTLIALRPAGASDLAATRIDPTTLAAALAVTLASALFFGVIGIVEARRHSANETLKGSAAATSANRAHRRLRSALVVSEIALSAMLVIGAGLVIRSLHRLQQTDLGFDATNLYAVTPPAGARDDAANARLTDETFARIRALPGVRAAVAEVPPGSDRFTVGRLEIDGEPPPPSTSSSFVSVNHVQPAFFATMGITFAEGATFADTADASAVIVNDRFARRHWPRGQAVGKRVRVSGGAGGDPWLRIVGVVRDAMTNGPMSPSDAPTFYLPRTTSAAGTILARTTGAANLLAVLRAEAPERGVSAPKVEAVRDFLSRSISEPRFVMIVMTAFGVVGLVLAAIGLYGVMAYTVAQEARDIGVRVALGASRGHIMKGVLGRGTALAAGGVALGLAAATWGTKLVEHHLFGVERLDPVSFGAAALVLIAAALAACVVPARRALAVDPIAAIRAD